MLRTPVFVLALAGLAALPLAAQDNPAAPAAHEEQVVVTVTATEEPVDEVPAAVEVITRAEIDAQRAVSVAELLAQVPGVHVAATGAAGAVTSIFTRGTNSTQTLVMLDGVPLNDPNFAGYDLANLTTDAVERIEVVRGPFSAVWGADAVGGVVNILTLDGKRAADGRPGRPFGGAVTLEGGEDSYRRGSLSVAGAAGPLDAAFSLWDRAGDGEFDDEFYEARGAQGRLGFDFGRGLGLGFITRWQESDLGVPFAGGVGSAPSPDRRQHAEALDVILPFTHRVSERWQWGLTLSRVATDYSFRDPDDAFGFVSQDVESWQTRARLSSTLRAGDHTVTAGAEWEEQQVDNADAYGENLRGDGDTNRAFFVQDEWRPVDAFRVDVGVRADDFDSFGSAVSPRVAVAWLPGSGAGKVWASYGESFRAPSVGELYFPFFSNANLDPEQGKSTELGARWALHEAGAGRNPCNLSLTLFRNDIRDLIQYDFARGTLANVGRARSEGAELALELFGGERIWGSASYTWLGAEDRDSGLDLLRRPHHSGALSVTWRPLAALTLNANGEYAGKRDDIHNLTFARVRADAYTKVDVAASFTWRFLTPYVRVENLFDEEYATAFGYPARGTTAVAGVKLAY